jgi:cysteine synthase A
VFHRSLIDPSLTSIGETSLIEGIGRPSLSPSFNGAHIDRAYAVSDIASLASTHVISELFGENCGGSTGTVFYVLCQLIAEIGERARGQRFVILRCDGGERYESSYFNPSWLSANGLNLDSHKRILYDFLSSGRFLGET